ncbi:hypothetical protein VCHC51A1_0294 [Vibrio cholerae HC-51A1]|nr:hypothetical protein VCHC02A1_0291 [Vibrio cholerae HC-02A1]EKG54534.1 hypothetical protein VCHC50A1_0295 [Vibrio cholerae HC-50A1]EKG59748.1 hypothetical protein VCHC52A1_0296 [Vibrio cholerae HC-52A1]EKG65234.1 hypothetical protein VCHC55A1_0298 [Vibrio cholerae HC-55A1]EKG94398.1 hypothetical protein VCHC51A1_0294 [Vibrio cholerae HC-51A1]EKL09239.1 hypothetical protein VCHC55C2_0298 [Vibrio cholerae HC-55C2]EKL17363.1 hypothetical protein VCHC59A1_0345 [Vibrio cholerae HC-59A1]EKM0191
MVLKCTFELFSSHYLRGKKGCKAQGEYEEKSLRLKEPKVLFSVTKSIEMTGFPVD